MPRAKTNNNKTSKKKEAKKIFFTASVVERGTQCSRLYIEKRHTHTHLRAKHFIGEKRSAGYSQPLSSTCVRALVNGGQQHLLFFVRVADDGVFSIFFPHVTVGRSVLQ